MASFKPSDVTITIGKGSQAIPITGWDFAGDSFGVSFVDSIRSFTIPKPKQRTYSKAIPVAGRSFVEYLSYRMLKDNLGFVSIQRQFDASTHVGSHISSVIPESVEDLLVYFHELGHNKSKQPPRANGGFMGGFSSCNGQIDCEYNAWVWAIKYFRRLGYQMTDSCKELIKKAFTSYLDNANDEGHASVRANQLSNLVGIDIKVRQKDIIFPEGLIDTFKTYENRYSPNTTFWCDEFTTIIGTEEFNPVKKPNGWKPWHDLKETQMKRQWKHQR